MLKTLLGRTVAKLVANSTKIGKNDTLGEVCNQIGGKRPKNVLKDTLGKGGYVIVGSTLQICKSGS